MGQTVQHKAYEFIILIPLEFTTADRDLHYWSDTVFVPKTTLATYPGLGSQLQCTRLCILVVRYQKDDFSD